MNKQKNYSLKGENWMTFFGGWWFFWVSIGVWLPIIFYSLLKNYGVHGIPWIYIIVAAGSLPPAFIFWFERPYPFDSGVGALKPRSISALSYGERKIISYWKSSKRIQNLILQTSFCLFILVFAIPIIKVFSSENNPISLSLNAEIFFKGFGLSILYLLFSFSILNFVLARHLLNHFDEIQQMELEPWPTEKPYMPGSMKYIPSERKKGPSFLGELFYFDRDTSFNWADFGAIFSAFLGFMFILFGMERLILVLKGVIEWKAFAAIPFGAILIQIARIIRKRKKKF